MKSMKYNMKFSNNCRNEKISIIIPIFNTSKYLAECLKSLADQTYENLEIILVNDGSTDDSGNICDYFAHIDSRFIVIHKKNTGVSDSRNVGVKRSTGSYITFVDSDDLVDADMIASLYYAIKNHNSDVSICRSITFDQSLPTYNHSKTTYCETLTNLEVITNLLYEKNSINSVFGKMYKKRLFRDVSFNDTLAYAEDLDINYRILSKAKKVTLSDSIQYFYRKRPGSAMNSAFRKIKMDCLKVAYRIHESTAAIDPELSKASELRIFTTSLFLLTQIPMNKEAFKQDILECKKAANAYKITVLVDRNARIIHRVYAFLSILNLNLLVCILKTKSYLRKSYVTAS